MVWVEWGGVGWDGYVNQGVKFQIGENRTGKTRAHEDSDQGSDTANKAIDL